MVPGREGESAESGLCGRLGGGCDPVGFVMMRRVARVRVVVGAVVGAVMDRCRLGCAGGDHRGQRQPKRGEQGTAGKVHGTGSGVKVGG